MSNIYDSDNQRDNEQRKFQADTLGEVAVNIRSNDLGNWVFKKVGRSIVKSVINSTTDDYSYQEASVEIFRIRVVYTNSSKNDFLSVERTV